MKDKVFSASEYTKYIRQVANTKLNSADANRRIPTYERHSIISSPPGRDIVSRSNFVQFSRGFLRVMGYYINTLNIPGYTGSLNSAGIVIDGNIIYATAGDKIVKFNTVSGDVSDLTVSSGAVNAFLHIYGDTLYIGTTGTSAYRVDKNLFASPTIYRTVTGTQCRGVASDSAGNIYVITLSGLIFKNVEATALNPLNAIGTNVNGGRGRVEDGVEYLYICDTGNHRVVKLNLSTPTTFTIFAGVTGESSIAGENVAAASGGTSSPRGIAFDNSGNAYITTSGAGSVNTVRIVNTAGNISTFAGQGPVGYSGDGGLARDALFGQPSQIQIHPSTGDIYIKDNSSFVIRVITLIDYNDI